MADLKISAMTAGTSLTSSDLVPAVQGSTNVNITPQQIQTYTLGSSGAGQTVTANAPIANFAQTWNNAGVTFTGMRIDITKTAYTAGSYLFRTGWSDNASFDCAFIIGNTTGDPKPLLKLGNNSYIGPWSNGEVLFSENSVNTTNSFLYSNTTNVAVRSGMFFGWSNSATDAAATLDTRLYRDAAAGILAQRNGTNAQTARVYNTYTDANNYERYAVDWKTTANVCYVRNEANGSGSARLMIPVTGASSYSGLPSAATAGAGARAFINDSSAAYTSALVGSTLAGAGANAAPVYSDGTVWRVG